MKYLHCLFYVVFILLLLNVRTDENKLIFNITLHSYQFGDGLILRHYYQFNKPP